MDKQQQPAHVCRRLRSGGREGYGGGGLSEIGAPFLEEHPALENQSTAAGDPVKSLQLLVQALRKNS